MAGTHKSVFEELKQVDALIDLHREPQMVEERLPFTVRIVQNEEDLLKAVRVRYEAYARHKPEFAVALREPEPDDTKPNTVVMLAESKLDGSALGTVRVQINRDRPLNMEDDVQLPPWLAGLTLSDARRLAVTSGGEGGLVKTILFKSLFLYWTHNEVDWAVVAARAPLTRTYKRLQFVDVLGGATFVPHPKENNAPHEVLAFEISSARARWQASNHPLLSFMCSVHHPDILLPLSPKFGFPDPLNPQLVAEASPVAHDSAQSKFNASSLTNNGQ